MAYDNLRIIRLQAENVKRLVAVDISPSGDMVTIAGRNGQGKTSVLDSILWAMAGGRSIQWKPIREGEESAKIRLELGNAAGLQLVVTRTFFEKEDGKFTTNLTVRTADGMKPQGEQSFLDALVGSLSFDPAAFIRAKADRQIEILKELITASDPDADFDAIEARRKKAFEDRTDANREERRLRAAAGSVEGDVEEFEDTSALLQKLASAGEVAQERARVENHRQRVVDQLERELTDVESLREQIASLQERLALAVSSVERLRRETDSFEQLPPLEDASSFSEQLMEMESRNNDRRVSNGLRKHLADADAKKAEAAALTIVIDECEKEVRDLIERADLPLAGLSLSPDSVMLRGVPFDQASDAEQLRASMALGMAANPKLRVLRIRDGSLLDDDALRVIQEVAGEMDFQIWLEKVGDGGPEAIILENGVVKD